MLRSIFMQMTVIYCSSPSAVQTLGLLLSASDVVQSHLTRLRFVLNADKSKELTSNLFKISTAQGVESEMVKTYKYLGVVIDQNLSFKPHIENLVSKLKLK